MKRWMGGVCVAVAGASVWALACYPAAYWWAVAHVI